MRLPLRRVSIDDAVFAFQHPARADLISRALERKYASHQRQYRHRDDHQAERRQTGGDQNNVCSPDKEPDGHPFAEFLHDGSFWARGRLLSETAPLSRRRALTASFAPPCTSRRICPPRIAAS